MLVKKSKEASRKELLLDDVMYNLGIGILIFGVLSSVIYQIIPNRWNVFRLPCIFHIITGYYCPGCGGRRAFDYLLNGNILKSIYFHPAVAYSIFVYGWYMITQTLERRKIGKVKAMSYRNRYVYIGIGITIINLIIKNLTLFIFNIRLI